MKHKVTNFHDVGFNTNNRVPPQIPNTQYSHQKITEQKVALDSPNRSNLLQLQSQYKGRISCNITFY